MTAKTTYTAELDGKTFTRKSANGYGFAVILVTEDADKVRAHMARNFAAAVEFLIKDVESFNKCASVLSGEWEPVTDEDLHSRLANLTKTWGAKMESVVSGPVEAARWSRTHALAVSGMNSFKLGGDRWEGQRYVIVPVS